MRIAIKLSLVLAATLLFVLDAPAQTLLKYKFAKGQSDAYELVLSSKVAQASPKVELEVKQTVELSQTVDEVLPDGSAKITWKFTRARTAISGTANTSVDSADTREPGKDAGPLAGPLAAAVKALVKVECSSTLSPTGELGDVRFSEAAAKELKGLPEMGDLFTEQGIKNTLSLIGFVASKDPVKKDASWSHKSAIKLAFGVVATDRKYTYDGPDLADGKKLEKITFTSNTTVDAKPDAPITIKITDQKGGVVLFDNDAGRIQSLVLRPMEMTVSFPNGLEQTVTRSVSLTRK